MPNLFPYTNTHELNLDWILQVVKKFQEDYTDFPADVQAALDAIEAAKNGSLSDMQTALTNALTVINTTINQAQNSIQAMAAQAEGAITTAENSALASINNAGTNQINDINERGTATLTSIAEEKDAAVTAIDTGRTTALNNIATALSDALTAITAADTTATDRITTAGSTALSNINTTAATREAEINRLYNLLPTDVQEIMGQLMTLNYSVFNWPGYLAIVQGRYSISSNQPVNDGSTGYVSTAYASYIADRAIDIYTTGGIVISALQVFTGISGESSFAVTSVSASNTTHFRYTFSDNTTGFAINLKYDDDSAIAPADVTDDNLLIFWDNNVVGPNRIASINASATVATQYYPKDTYFWWKGRVCKAITNINQGDVLYTTGASRNCIDLAIGDQVTTNINYIKILDSIAGTGVFTIPAGDIEAGQWYVTAKQDHTTRCRLKYLIPVRKGMLVSYANTTLDTYFGIAESENSLAYANTPGWKSDGEGSFIVPVDGFMTFIVRNHADATIPVTPADYNSVVTITTTLTSLATGTMILNQTSANTLLDDGNGGADVNNAEKNKVYCIGAAAYLPVETPNPNRMYIANVPYDKFYGNVVSLCFRISAQLPGILQIALSGDNRLLTRTHFSGTWTTWREWQDKIVQDTVYNVGPTRTYTSIVSLLKAIQTDDSPKIIYIDEGVYDIFQDYLSNNIPVPPSNVQSYNYFDYNVFVPKNTKIIGIGNVVFKWEPTTAQLIAACGDEATAKAASKTWSPLNLWYGNNTIENISIQCTNCRYGLHDDSHNAYTNFKQIFNNFRIFYTASDAGYGFNSPTGFGFEDGSTYVFDNCVFQYIGTGNHGILYGHDGQAGGATIIVNNCLLLGGSDSNNRSVMLQSLRADDSNRIYTYIANTYIQGGIYLNQGAANAGQFFEVRLVKSGNPAQTVDIALNPYPIQVYQ